MIHVLPLTSHWLRQVLTDKPNFKEGGKVQFYLCLEGDPKCVDSPDVCHRSWGQDRKMDKQPVGKVQFANSKYINGVALL